MRNGNWFAGTAGQIAGFITSPEVFMTFGLAGTGMRGVSWASRIGKGATLGVAGDVLNEAALHDTQNLRTLTQSAINIASASVLTGLVSGAFGKQIARPTTKWVHQELAENFNNHGMRSVGSAEAYDYASERIINQPWITSGMLSPMRPLAASQSAESLHWFSNLWEHGYTLGKTQQGRAQQIAMETVATQETSILLRESNLAVNKGYKEFVGATSRLDLALGVKKNWGQREIFERLVHYAMINKDKAFTPNGMAPLQPNQIAAIETTAQALRSNVFNRTLALAKESGMADPEDFAVKFADSYVPRRWNRNQLISDEIEFKERLAEAYRQDTAEKRLAELQATTEKELEAAQKETAKSQERLVSVSQKYKTVSDEADRAVSAERSAQVRSKAAIDRANKAQTLSKRLVTKANATQKEALKDANGASTKELLDSTRLSLREYKGVVDDIKQQLKQAQDEIRARKQAEGEISGNVAEPEAVIKEGNVARTRAQKGNVKQPEPAIKEGNVVRKSAQETAEAERIADLREALDEARFIVDEQAQALRALESNAADAVAQVAKAEQKVATSLTTMARQIRRVRNAQRKIWRKKQKQMQKRLSRSEEGLALARVARAESLRKTPDEFRPIVDSADDRHILDSVQTTFEKLAYGYDADVYMSPVARRGFGSPWKNRVVPIEDMELLDKGWLLSDMESITRSHINHMVKPSYMKMYAGDADMTEVLESIGKHYDGLIENAEDAVRAETNAAKKQKLEKKLSKLTQEKISNVKMHELMRDRFYGRTSIPKTRAGALVNEYLRALRNVNTSLMMGMVLPTSLGDVSRYNMATIFAPELGAKGGTLLKAFKTVRLSKEEWRKIGIADEVVNVIRSAKILDGTDIIGTHGASVVADTAVHATGAAAKALMRATFLTHWTDYGKLMSAGYMQNDIIQKVVGYDVLKDSTKSALARLGIDEQLAKKIRTEVERGLTLAESERGISRVGSSGMDAKAYATVVEFDNWADQGAANTFKNILYRESERSLVSPRVGDMPMYLGDTELGRSIAQFTSFLFSAVQQVGVPLGKRMRYDMDPKAYRIGAQLILGGMFSTLIRHAGQGRLDELEDWTPMDWVLNGADYSGAVPLQMYAFNGINLLTKGGLAEAVGGTTMSRYVNRPNMSFLLGPTGGTIENLIKVGQIPFSEDGLTETELRQLKRIMLFNNLPFAYLPYQALEEQLVEESMQ